MEVQLFNSPQFGQIRTAGTPDKPMFCASDVAGALGYANPAKAIIDHCKGVTVLETPTPGGVQSMKYITEPDLYRLIFKSKAPYAEEFNSWVSEVVLPSIRKNGGYIQASPEETPEQIMAKAVIIAQKTIDMQKRMLNTLKGQNVLLAEENKALAPKAQYTDQVLQAKDTYTHSEMAKELNFKSWVTFIDACKKDGILFKQSGIYMLYSKYAGKGYMKTRTTPYPKSDGTVGTNTISVWTEIGRKFLHEHFNVEMQPVEFTIDL